MSDDGLVECLLCGKSWKSLGHHLRHGHRISANEYRDRFDIRRSAPLTSPATRARFSAAIRSTIDTGGLAAHYAGNAERAADAAEAGRKTRASLCARGLGAAPGAPALCRAEIASVVEAIEAGAKVSTAVKRSKISYSGFHSGLARYPDLKTRVAATKAKGPE